MSDKVNLLREADGEFAAVHRAIDGLTEAQMREVWLGSWSIREILVHISGWHRAMIPALEHITRGEEPYPKGTYDDYDGWNARFVQDKAGVKVADVLAELDASYQAFVAAAGRVPEQDLAPGGAARELFDGVASAHYREHAAQIREWRQAAAR
jgi:hypothetical protein